MEEIESAVCTGIHEERKLLFTDGLSADAYEDSEPRAQSLRASRDGNLKMLQEHEDAARQGIRSIEQAFRNALSLRSEPDVYRADHGVLQNDLLWKVSRCENPQLFEKIVRQEPSAVVVELLIDASGSQSVRQSMVALQSYLFSAALSRIRIPHRVMSYCTYGNYTVLRRFRDYDDKSEADRRILEYRATSNNRDGLALAATAIGCIIGLLCGILNTIPCAKNDPLPKRILLKILRVIIRIYVEVFRGTPMMLQAVFIFYALPYFTDNALRFDNIWAASILIVSINTGAYMAESVRGGIISIDPGQTEGAKAIGMTHFQTMTSVILPQAIRNILPQIGNNYIINVKDTSVMFIIGFTEFFASHRYIVGINNKYFPSAVIEMAGYLAMTLIASGILRLIEKLMDGSDSYELVQEDPLTMTAGTYSHPKRGSNYDEQSKEFRERTEQELKFGRSRGDR